MNLLVESGATKSSWIVFDQNQLIHKQVLSGINPTSNPASVDVIQDFSYTEISEIDNIHYYGAGVSSDESRTVLLEKLTLKFGKKEILCDNDILAAARSVSDGQTSIVSILGTGTNTAIYDGEKLLPRRRALGYIFEDYGSGFHIGKIIVQKYYADKMSKEDSTLFHNNYIAGQRDLISRIYESSRPNYQVASLSKFLSCCSGHLKAEVLEQTFHSFFEYQIKTLENGKNYKLNFVGSISEVFEKELRLKAASCGYDVVTVCGNPIDRLLAYHQKHYH